MSYRITGLDREPFAALFDMDDAALAEQGAVRVTAGADKGWPCRISLEDAKAGEDLILLNYVSHDVATPYRSAYAIYLHICGEVRERRQNMSMKHLRFSKAARWHFGHLMRMACFVTQR